MKRTAWLLLVALAPWAPAHGEDKPVDRVEQTVHFPIVSTKDAKRNIVSIAFGKLDGIAADIEGSIFSRYEHGKRRYEEIGTATVKSVTDHAAVLRVTMRKPLAEGDMAVLPVQVPARAWRSLHWRLACLDVRLADVFGEPLFEYRALLKEDTPELERRRMDAMAAVIRREAAEVREGLAKSLNPGPLDGPYAGRERLDLLLNAKPADVDLFLQYVKEYSLSYMGRSRLTGRFESWVNNDTPLPAGPLRDYLLTLPTTEARARFIERSGTVDADLDSLSSNAIEIAYRGDLDLAEKTSALTAELAKALNRPRWMRWCAFANAEILRLRGLISEAIPRSSPNRIGQSFSQRSCCRAW